MTKKKTPETESETKAEMPADAANDAGAESASKADGDEGGAEAKCEDEDEDEDEEKSEKKEKKDKKKKDKGDKPKKIEVEFEASMPRTEAISYFEAIIGGLRSGRLEFKQSGDALVLSPPDQLDIEVSAQQKGDKGKIVFEISWRDGNRALEILN